MPADNKIAGIPLVDDWRNWKRWWSMRLIVASSLFGSVALALQSLSPEQAALLPSWLPTAAAWSALFTNILTGAARVIRQAPEGE
jgi:hypothetical protein